MQLTEHKQPRIRLWIKKILGKDRLAHAYLFDGKKGSGKKDLAAYFAQSIFCEQPTDQEPCTQCTECIRIQNRNHPDVHWIEPEGSSIKIEQVRLLQKEFSYRGVESARKVYIIDRIELMTTQAVNSLLKFLEEPHAGTTALLLSEQRHRLLPTIISRCQEIKLDPPSLTTMIAALQDEYGRSLAYLASHITADLEEALTLCQAEWFAELRNLVLQLTEEVNHSSSQAFFSIQDKWLKVAKEREQIDIALELLLFWYKDLLYAKLEVANKYIYVDQMDRLQKQALYLSQEKIARGIEAILSGKKRLHANMNPQLLLEQLVLRLKEG